MMMMKRVTYYAVRKMLPLAALFSLAYGSLEAGKYSIPKWCIDQYLNSFGFEYALIDENFIVDVKIGEEMSQNRANWAWMLTEVMVTCVIGRTEYDTMLFFIERMDRDLTKFQYYFVSLNTVPYTREPLDMRPPPSPINRPPWERRSQTPEPVNRVPPTTKRYTFHRAGAFDHCQVQVHYPKYKFHQSRGKRLGIYLDTHNGNEKVGRVLLKDGNTGTWVTVNIPLRNLITLGTIQIDPPVKAAPHVAKPAAKSKTRPADEIHVIAENSPPGPRGARRQTRQAPPPPPRGARRQAPTKSGRVPPPPPKRCEVMMTDSEGLPFFGQLIGTDLSNGKKMFRVKLENRDVRLFAEEDITRV